MQLRPAPRPLPPLASKFARFLLTGSVCTGIQYVLLILLTGVFGVPPTGASTVGYLASALLNYRLSHSFTYRSNAQHQRSLPRFVMVSACGLAINAAVMFVGTTRTSLHYLLVQVMATGAALLWNFFANLHWTFGQEQS